MTCAVDMQSQARIAARTVFGISGTWCHRHGAQRALAHRLCAPHVVRQHAPRSQCSSVVRAITAVAVRPHWRGAGSLPRGCAVRGGSSPRGAGAFARARPRPRRRRPPSWAAPGRGTPPIQIPRAGAVQRSKHGARVNEGKGARAHGRSSAGLRKPGLCDTREEEPHLCDRGVRD